MEHKEQATTYICFEVEVSVACLVYSIFRFLHSTAVYFLIFLFTDRIVCAADRYAELTAYRHLGSEEVF